MRTAEEWAKEFRGLAAEYDGNRYVRDIHPDEALCIAEEIEALAKERDEAKFDLLEVATKSIVWKHELEKLREWKRRAVKVLAECEWLYFGALDECVVCDSYSPRHKEDCELAALLKEATDAEPSPSE